MRTALLLVALVALVFVAVEAKEVSRTNNTNRSWDGMGWKSKWELGGFV